MEQGKAQSDTRETCIRRRNRITIQQKKEICEYKRKHPDAFAREIFLHFQNKWPNVVAPSTISKILMSGDKWLNQQGQDSQRKTCTRIYHPRNIPLERALYKWYTGVKDSMTVSNEILKEKARALAKLMNMRNFSCSNNWVYSFKKRHSLLKYTHKVSTGKSFLNIDLDYPSDMREYPPSSVSNKISYMEDDFGNGTIYVTSPVSAEEARQGLISAMGYLAAHSCFSRDNIDLLWMIFQQITNEAKSGKTQHLSDDSQENSNVCDEKPQDAAQTAHVPDVFNADMDLGQNDKMSSSEVNELHRQQIDKFNSGSIPDETLEPHAEGTVSDDTGVIPGSGKIQLAVEGADGKYLYVMSESDSLEGDFNLNESLPEILQAAGHSLEAGVQFIETIDQCSGLRMISKHLPQSEDDGIIQLLSLSSDNKADGVLGNVSLADGVAGDHAYVNVMSVNAGDGLVKMEAMAALPQTKITDSIQQTEIVDALPRMDFSDVISPLETMTGSKREVPIKEGDSGSVMISDEDGNTKCDVDETRSDEASTRKSEVTTKLTVDVIGDINAANANIDAEVNRSGSGATGKECAISEKSNTDSHIKATLNRSVTSADTVDDSQLSTAWSDGLQTKSPMKWKNASSVVSSPNVICVKPCSVRLSPLPDLLFSDDNSKEQAHICVHCSKIFMSFANLENHSRTCSKRLNVASSGLMKYNYSCCLCEKVFSRQSSYKWHMKSHDDGECSCITCSNNTKRKSKVVIVHDKKNSVTMSEDALAEDLVSKPSEKNESSECDVDTTEPPVCHTSGVLFKNSSHPQSRNAKCHDSKEWKCSSCGRCFLRSADLKRHSRVHLLPQDVSCKICGKTFVNRSNLHKHSRLHTGVQHYNCSMCGKRFINSVSLKEHKKLHQSIRNKKCEICGRTFVLVRNLNMHMLMHDEVEKTQI